MSDEAAYQAQGVTVEPLSTVDLDGGIDGRSGRELPIRSVTLPFDGG